MARKQCESRQPSNVCVFLIKQSSWAQYKLLIVPCFQSRVRIFLPAEWKLAGRVRRSRGPGCGSAGSEEAGLGRLPFIHQALGCQVKYERTSSFMLDGNMHWASSTLGSMLGRSNAPSNPNFSANFNDSTLYWSSMPTALNALIQVVRGNTLAMVSAIICNQSAVETDPSIASDFLFRHPFQKVFLNMAKRCVSQGCRNAVSLAGMTPTGLRIDERAERLYCECAMDVHLQGQRRFCSRPMIPRLFSRLSTSAAWFGENSMQIFDATTVC